MDNLDLQKRIDMRYSAFYIQSTAHNSYRHWWNHLGYMLDIEYDHIFRPNKPRWPRYRYTRLYDNRRPIVEHTVVLPTSQELTYIWQSCHGGYGWRRNSNYPFRKPQKFIQHGIEKKTDRDQARQDWREHKQFKRDQAKRQDRHGCPPWLKRQCNKDYRQWVRKLIESQEYDKIGTKLRKDYFDPWMWS